MNKTLLITHTDLDGISPVILLNLTGINFEYKNIEITEVEETFNELFDTNINDYEQIYVTDLSLTQNIYDYINSNNINNIKVFDHHETHLFANENKYVTVKVDIDDVKTCGTELFYLYLKDIYKEIDKPIIKDYVRLVRELDTYTFTSDKAKELDFIRNTLGKTNFIKSITKRLKKDADTFEFTTFEKRYVKVKKEEQLRYLLKKEEKMFIYEIHNRKCGVVFAESHKSELGNFLSDRHPELDLIILIDASSRISYRTSREDISVSEFATIYGGGGHRKASGSDFDNEMRKKIIELYFKDVKLIETEEV